MAGRSSDKPADSLHERIEVLESRNAALSGAISLLHRVGTLVRDSSELEPTCYAILTAVTAGVGLGLNRAMLFFVDESNREVLRGVAGVGPSDGDEADRVWRSIESEALELEALYEAGLQQHRSPGSLDRRVRQTTVRLTDNSPVSLALRCSGIVYGTVAGGDGDDEASGAGDDDLAGLLHLPTAVAAPLRGRDKTYGVLYADNCFTGRTLGPSSRLVLSLVADNAGRAIESAHRYERLAERARTDALTGLGHHGAMMEALSRALSTAESSVDDPLGLAMIDLDDFKRVNDTFGHLAGDALLVGVAARLRAVLRSGEIPFRYGGEEFVVLFPAITTQGLGQVGERLRLAVAERPFAIGGESLTVTCSVGLASHSASTVDAQGLIDVADQALLRAKEEGKNRVLLGS